MAEKHPSLHQPKDATISVWRYTDLSKFVWMLQNSALYFARADLLGDPFEGYVTKKMEVEGPLAEEREMSGGWGTYYDGVSGHMYVNCWHMAKHESAAMWKLYTCNNHSICIRSTYQQLWDCLPPKRCYLGEVTYLDYDSESFDLDYDTVFNCVMHKRISFSHEREVRAVMPDLLHRRFSNELPPTHKKVDVDLKKLIHNVYIGPTAAPPLLEVVRKLLEQAGFAIEVKKSRLNAPPAY